MAEVTKGELREAQAASQLAQQAAQAARQATQQAEQAVQAAQQAARGVGAETSAASIETDISPISIGDAWRANIKRTYDAYQAEDLESLRLARRTAENLAAAHTDHVRDLQAQLTRLHANSITHDNDLNKQHLAHRDIATNRTWNIDEVAHLVASMDRVGVSKDAIAAAVAAVTAANAAD